MPRCERPLRPLSRNARRDSKAARGDTARREVQGRQGPLHQLHNGAGSRTCRSSPGARRRSPSDCSRNAASAGLHQGEGLREHLHFGQGRLPQAVAPPFCYASETASVRAGSCTKHTRASWVTLSTKNYSVLDGRHGDASIGEPGLDVRHGTCVLPLALFTFCATLGRSTCVVVQ